MYTATLRLVEALGLAHGGLNVGGLEVLPVLLEEGDEVVDGHVDVLADLLLGHLGVTDAGAEAEDLLELELDGGLGLEDLVLDVLTGVDGGGELTGTVHVGADDTGNGLDDGVGGEEGVVLGAHLLDELLVLVELLEVIHVHGGDADLLAGILEDEVSDDADLHAGAADVGEAEGAGETLVLLAIVVLEVKLEVDGLLELTVLAVLEHGLDALLHVLRGDLGGHLHVLLFENRKQTALSC